MMNDDIIKGKWTELKGEIKTQWGNLTDDELDKSQGNVVSIIGLILQKYGSKKEEVQEQMNGLMSRFTQKTEEVKNNLKNDSLH